jgi:hypothetical protein
MTALSDNLLTRLLTAEVVCRDCGSKYGKYSVGCSSTWNGTCDVCGEDKPITEVRDWGYLTKGVKELKGNVKEQSKVVASYMASVGPIMSDDELEDCLKASYEQGEITCKFTEEEVTALATLIDDVSDKYPPGQDVNFDSAFEKITELYEDHCVKYELSPALRAYNDKYGTWGSESDEEMKRWEGFRDAFVMLEGGNA